jgi:hypothetical protein
MQWPGIVVGLWYLTLLVIILANPARPGASIGAGIFISTIGLLTIGGCIHRLRKKIDGGQ